MESQGHASTANSTTEPVAPPFPSPKPASSRPSSSSLQVIEKVAFVEAVARRPEGVRRKSQAGRPLPGRTASSGGRSASPRSSPPETKPRMHFKGVRSEEKSRRPTVGLLSPRKGIGKRLAMSPSGVRALAAANMPPSPEYVRRSRTSPPRCGPGIGKVLFPPLKKLPPASSEDESSSEGIRRRRSPPPIRGSPGTMEWSDEDEEGDDVEALKKKIAALKLKINNMDERVAETQIESMDVEDKVEVLRKAMTSKVKRLYKATGFSHLYHAEEK